MKTLKEYKEMVAPYVCDVSEFPPRSSGRAASRSCWKDSWERLKDPDHGIYPMVTSSSTLAAYGAIGAGVPPYTIKDIITVVKAYSSAVGGGAFVSEILDEEEAEELRKARR